MPRAVCCERGREYRKYRKNNTPNRFSFAFSLFPFAFFASTLLILFSSVFSVIFVAKIVLNGRSAEQRAEWRDVLADFEFVYE